MGSLVKKFQADLISGEKPATELLRTAKLISAKLDLRDISEWLDRELGGYTDVSTIPNYRLIRGGNLQVWNAHRGWVSMSHLEMGFPVGQSISEVEQLVKAETVVISLPQSDKFPLTHPFGMDVSHLPQQITIAPVQLRGLIESVRNKLLDWALELEKRGIEGDGMSFNEDERKSAHNQIFNIENATGVFGNVSASQVTIYDYSSIHEAVKGAGVPREARNEIEDILDELKKADLGKRKSLVKRGKAWAAKNQELLGATASIVLKALGVRTDS